MMSWWSAVLIGVVQGITECLPVSSSAHLAFAERILGIRAEGVGFEVVLHLGTLCATLFFFRTRWVWLLANLRDPAAQRAIGMLMLATLPVVLIGAGVHDRVEAIFHDVRHIALSLILCGLFLLLTGFRKPAKGEVGWGSALGIGVAQAFAILPGISRSGMTVGAGVMAGVKGERAVEFAFLLSIPAVLGATLLELQGIGAAAAGAGWGNLLIAAIAACVSGYAAIGALIRLVSGGRLPWFGCYCIVMGLLWLLAA
ncbi:MAG: undecaprenyl-diphosphate phosphatase [Candidatus Aureabacteria bacterium]|nr:undecaprenyl-diphosphate phosphatase [Candidatus Auribacterota bacterium]